MNIRAFTIALVTSTVLQVGYIAVSSLVSWLILPQIFGGLPATGGPANPAQSTVLIISFLTGGVGTLLAPLVYLGTGMLYGILHYRAEGALRAEDGAFGGGAAAALARVLQGFLATGFSLILIPRLLGAAFGQPGLPPPGGIPGSTYPAALIGGTLSGLFGICIGGLIAAGLGALGGALVAAIRR